MVKRFGVILLTVSLTLFTLITLQKVATLSSTLFVPNLFRFWIAALILGLLQSFLERSPPQLSVRLIHSATAAGVLFLAVPNVLWMWALRGLPLSFVALTIAVVPLWINVLNRWKSRRHVISGIVSIIGLALAAHAVVDKPGEWLLVLAAVLAALSSSLAGLMAKHLFWIHATVNLNLWSMVFGAAILVPAALVNGEISYIRTWTNAYWTELLLLAVVSTALGAFLYRRMTFFLNSQLTALLLISGPVYALGMEIARSGNVSAPLVSGALLVLFPLAWLSFKSPPMDWLYQYLANSRRIGDRITVDIQGFVKTEKASGPIRITSLSIGGLGFETDIYCPVSERILVTIPMGKNFTTVTFDTVSAFTAKIASDSATWRGGLAFRKLNLATTQILAEFVARFSEVEPSDEPAIEITREWNYK